MITRRSLFGLGAGVAATAVGISTTKAAPEGDLKIIEFAGQAFPEEFKIVGVDFGRYPAMALPVNRTSGWEEDWKSGKVYSVIVPPKNWRKLA